MAFDSAQGTVVLFGGTSRGRELDDTWTWDGLTWTEQRPAARPPARAVSVLAPDAAGNLVLFGGLAGTTILADTWTWDGRTWTEKQGGTSPPGRIQATLTYHAGARLTLLYGGGGDRAAGLFRDTWVWDGGAWQEPQLADSPDFLRLAASGYDPARRVVTLFGGQFHNDLVANTWTWDGTKWMQQRPAHAPSPRQTAMSVVPASGHAVLFGGRSFTAGSLGDTWIWDGTDWTQRLDGGPAPRFGHAMADDGRRVILFGGQTLTTTEDIERCDTWSFEE